MSDLTPASIHELPTPAVIVDIDALDRNLAGMTSARPGGTLRPHVKAHKCTALAARQATGGHRSFTCATVREMLGMAAAGLADDLLLANEVVDGTRLASLAAAQEQGAGITIAVDSPETIDAAAGAGIRHVVVDVDIGLPRCGCPPDAAASLADLARSRGLVVRGVMGYEGHLMAIDRADQRERVPAAFATLVAAHDQVGGDLGVPVISTGGTGTFDLHPLAVTDAAGRDVPVEVQAGSYALMDTDYGRRGHPFEQACWVLGTVISRSRSRHLVADVGLKSLGMDHGNPSIQGATVWFCSDEHVTFAPDDAATHPLTGLSVGDRIRVLPAHVDPTLAMHESIWVVRGDQVLDQWPIDLRGW